MLISEAVQRMIEFYEGSLHDISHFLKVYAFAKTIGEQEELDSSCQQSLELAAIVHDIGCPLCLEKYGSTNGKFQEREGEILARAFLEELECDEELVSRVCFLVAHHHTYQDVDGLDYQILLEADYLVNADESSYSIANIQNTLENIFKTETGIQLLTSMYLPQL